MAVPGLTLLENFLTEEDEKNLISLIDSKPWITILRRRTQQYGRNYDYGAKILGPAPIIPQELEKLGSKIPGFDRAPEQIIVNEYQPGQGISAHTDHYRHFGPVIASVSLGSEVPMIFRKSGKEVTIQLPRRSVVILTGDARHSWTHEIPARRRDNGIERGRRISVTYRTIIYE